MQPGSLHILSAPDEVLEEARAVTVQILSGQLSDLSYLLLLGLLLPRTLYSSLAVYCGGD